MSKDALEIKTAILSLVELAKGNGPEEAAKYATAALDLTKVWGIFYSYEQSAAMNRPTRFSSGGDVPGTSGIPN
jgi:hypothetical protein